MESKENAFQCSVCQKSCLRCEELSVHLMTHTVVELARALTLLQIRLLRLEQEEVPVSNETTQDIHKSDETKDPMKLKAKQATIEKKKGKSNSGVHKSGSRQPQTCSVCAAVLSSRGALTKHMIIHQEKKPFQCQECSQSFNQARDLKTHTMQRHSSVRPHICGICGKGFVHKSYLMEHMSYHTGERQFQCYHCGNRFQAQSALVKHMKRHTASKDFACNNCPKAFAVKTDLKSHIRLVHEKPQASCTTKPIPTENIIENSTSTIAEDDTNANAVMDETTPQEKHQEANKVNNAGKKNDESLVSSQSVKRAKDLNCEGVQDVIKSSGPDNNSENLLSNETNSSTTVNIASAETNAVDDKIVPSLDAAVDDQKPVVLISKSPLDKAKEITPYIPNVPKF